MLLDAPAPDLTPAQSAKRDEILHLLEHGPWSDSLSLTFIVTNKCNLRCTHCNVKEWLTHKAEADYPFEQMLEWAEQIAAFKGQPKKYAGLIGGEVTTVPERLEKCVHMLADRGWAITLISNLTKLPEDIEFLRKVDRIQISVDGLSEDHDKQRGKGTFATTYRNLRRLFQADLGNNIIVQACLPSDYGEEKCRRFLEAMVYAGADPSKVSFGGMTTGYDDREIARDKLPLKHTYLAHKPCCEYKVMSNFTITPDGDVFSSYHGVGRPNHRLGTIQDSPETIRERFRNMVGRLVWVNDPKCLECPALKRCWGMFCFQIFKYGNTPKPSDHCQQERMIELNEEWIKRHGNDIATGIPIGEVRDFCS